MSWLQKLLPPKINRTQGTSKKVVPEGLWSKCPSCDAVLYRSDLESNAEVCPKCGHHHRISARRRLDLILDAEGRFEIGADVLPVDPLKFKDTKRYADRLKATQSDLGETDSLIVMQGSIKTIPAVVAAFEFKFMGGSMGSVMGERFSRGVQACIEHKMPFVCVSASGGARMQEAGLPYISVLTDPTMGGVSASFAMLGDVIIAEPNALIGFAGPRVIEQTVREKLPEGFQRAEFLLEHGAIDMIVDRRQMRDKLATLIASMQRLPAVA